ncbi:hypothetical protein EX30DRAFT_374265 [Ascodesmis nigricans]|uniref:Uncharacterized protein n=1 Tax=Ascodesmis nigricans TaxID=341454 RepID=A0A4S2MLN3_9PEZI|nr:hypothetical protein EX30DRAFT_374265 [Ascodesmis nigricans]
MQEPRPISDYMLHYSGGAMDHVLNAPGARSLVSNDPNRYHRSTEQLSPGVLSGVQATTTGGEFEYFGNAIVNVALGGNLSMVDNPTTFTSSNSSLPYYMDGHRPDGDENELLDMLNSGQRDLNLGLLGRLPMWVEHHQQQYSAPQTASTNDQTRFQISNPNTRLQHALNAELGNVPDTQQPYFHHQTPGSQMMQNIPPSHTSHATAPETLVNPALFPRYLPFVAQDRGQLLPINRFPPVPAPFTPQSQVSNQQYPIYPSSAPLASQSQDFTQQYPTRPQPYFFQNTNTMFNPPQ